MRFVLRSLFRGERPRTEDVHPDTLMSIDSPPPAVEPLLRAIAADPRQHELAGFQEPLSHYRAAFPTSRPSVRKTWRTVMLSPIGAVVAGFALTLGGTAAAAYTGSLPTPAQNFAHNVIGAPAAHPTGTPTQDRSQDRDAMATRTQDRDATATRTQDRDATGTPVGPNATGTDAAGLCTAWTLHQATGASTTADESIAFKNLATAAGGTDKIATYCVTIMHQGDTKQPTAQPTQAPTSHPTDKAGTQPTSNSTRHGG